MPPSRTRLSRPAKTHAMCLRSEGPQDLEVRVLKEEVKELRAVLQTRDELLRQQADEIARLKEEVARRVEVPPVVVATTDEAEENEGSQGAAAANTAAQQPNVDEDEEDEDEDEKEELNEEARLALLEIVGDDDIRVRYWDRFKLWISLRNVLYHAHEIRADTELARFWNYLVMECPAVNAVVDEIARVSQSTVCYEEDQSTSASEDDANEAEANMAEPSVNEEAVDDDSDKENVPPPSPYRVHPNCDFSVPNRDGSSAEPSEGIVSDAHDDRSEGGMPDAIMMEEIFDDEGSDKENAAPRISYFVPCREQRGTKRTHDDDEEGTDEPQWKRFHC